jgi:hypothetical protein
MAASRLDWEDTKILMSLFLQGWCDIWYYPGPWISWMPGNHFWVFLHKGSIYYMTKKKDVFVNSRPPATQMVHSCGPKVWSINKILTLSNSIACRFVKSILEERPIHNDLLRNLDLFLESNKMKEAKKLSWIIKYPSSMMLILLATSLLIKVSYMRCL